MNLSIIKTIMLKELKETLRDKRTLFAMLGIPILLYPILIIVVGQVLMLQQGKIADKMSNIAIVGEKSETLQSWLGNSDKITISDSQKPNEDLASGKLNAIVEFQSFDNSQQSSSNINLRYDNTDEDSKLAITRIRDCLNEKNREILEKRLKQAGFDASYAKPLIIVSEDMAPPTKTTGSLLGKIIPMLMIIMLAMGAFYPAVDLTAGEKERGTFETLLATPVTKKEIIWGKFLTVFTLSMITGLLNLASMIGSLLLQFSQMSELLEKGNGALNFSLNQLSIGNIGLICLVMIPLAFLICSLMMTIALFARDFKQAQNLLSPFMLLVMMPGLYASLPGVELDATTRLVPITNVALLCKDLLMGTMKIDDFFLVFILTAAYSAIALTIASAIFQSEDIILAEDKGIPLTLKRNQFRPRNLPTMGTAFILFGFAILAQYYVGGFWQSRDIIAGAIGTQWIFFAAIPMLFLLYTKVDIKNSYSIKMPNIINILATTILAICSLILVMQYSMIQSLFLKTPDMSSIFQEETSTIMTLIAFAVTPAFCEELLFRGAILGALREKLKPLWIIVISATLFSLLHQYYFMIGHTFLLGLVLGYLVWRTKSVFTGIIFHLFINGSQILMVKDCVPVGIITAIEDAQKQHHFPIIILAISLIVAILTIIIIEKYNTHHKVRTSHIFA